MRRFLFLAQVFLAFALQAEPYRFLTLNVWSEGTNQTARGEAEGVFINAHDPDLVALQELTPEFWASKLVRWMSKGRDAVGEKLGPKGEDAALALFFRRERFELVRKGAKWFCPERDPQKGVVWAELKDRTSGERLLVYSTQLEEGPDGDEKVRVAEAKMLLMEIAAAAKDGAAVVGAGDFGAFASAPSLRGLARFGWQDGQLTTHPGLDTRHTWHDAPVGQEKGGYRGTAPDKSGRSGRFDHFLYDPTRVEAYSFGMDAGQGILDVSDHVMVYFSFRTHPKRPWKVPAKIAALTPVAPPQGGLPTVSPDGTLVLRGRTEHALWQIEHGALASAAIRTVAVAVGDGNLASRPDPEETAIGTIVGVRAVVEAVRERRPEVRIELRPLAASGLRAAVVNREIRTLENERHVVWMGGPDVSPAGDVSLPRTCRPVSRLSASGSHGRWWWANRLEERQDLIARSGGVFDIVMFGDSITHFWEDFPHWSGGRDVLETLTAKYSILNLGYGGDRTENLLWRGEHGELDGYAAKCVMLMIGTNNGGDSPADTAEGIRRILALIARKQPQATVLLLPVFPRGKPDDGNRVRIAGINGIIRGFADGRKVVWLDFTDRFLEPDGSFRAGMMVSDLLHPHRLGYETWRDAVLPKFREICGK